MLNVYISNVLYSAFYPESGRNVKEFCMGLFSLNHYDIDKHYLFHVIKGTFKKAFSFQSQILILQLRMEVFVVVAWLSTFGFHILETLHALRTQLTKQQKTHKSMKKDFSEWVDRCW